jgi:nicotinate-nucleotide adenylyltransferase
MKSMDLWASEGRKVAFFGGSFDPPHRGHLAVARAAQVALALDTVLFAPVGVQPLKPQGSTASFADRLAMTELAIQCEPNFAISLADSPVTDGGHNYTFDTLVRLRNGLAAGTKLYCLMGADSFLNLRSWHRAAEIPFAAPLIVAARPGQPLDDVTNSLPAGLSIDTPTSECRFADGVEILICAIRNSAGECAPFFLLPGLHVEVSATEIRHQVQAAVGRQCEGRELLPDRVREYIAAHGLYRAA